MRFTTERDTLTAAIETVAPAVVGAHDICSMVRLEVEGTELVVQATNYESMIESRVPAGLTAEAGVVLTPHAVLAKLCPKLPSGPVEVSVDGFGLEISAKGFTGTLGMADPSLWPAWNRQEAANPLQITPEGAEMARKVLKSAARDDKRVALTGIHLGSGQIEATDGERWTRGVFEGLPADDGIVLPAKFLAGVLRNASGDLTLTYNGGQAYITEGTTTWASTLVAEQFPNTKPFLATAVAYRATLPTAPLLEAIERLTAVAVDEFDPLVLRADGDLTLALKSDRGEVVQDLEGSHDLPDGWAQGLNPARFTDAVKSMRLDEIEVLFGDGPMKAIRLEDGEHIQLMVPRDVNQREKQRAEAKAAAIIKEQAKH